MSIMLASLRDGNLEVHVRIERELENSDCYEVKLKASLYKIVEESETLHIKEHTGLRDQEVQYIQKKQYNRMIREKCIDIGRSLIEKYKKSMKSK